MTEKDKLLKNLIEKSGKTKEDIEKLVADKVNELSGLVSAEGAIYIIANELNIRLDVDKPKKDASMKKIEDVTEAKTPISLNCKVIRKYDRVNFSSEKGTEGSVQSTLVGDDTGVIRVVFWNDKTDLLDNIQEQDILSIKNAYTRENTNSERIEIHYTQYSEIEVNPEGVDIQLKEYVPTDIEFSEKKINDLEEGERNIKLKGLITDFDIPRYYLACPHTFKKVFQDDGKYLSPVHGEVEPIKVPIVNVVIDDGSSSIVVVGFRDRAEELVGSKTNEIISLTEDIEKYRDFSKKIIGSQVEIGGNVGVSSLTGEKQIIVNQVMSVEFQTVDEVAKELVEEDNKDKESTKKEENSNSEDKKEEKKKKTNNEEPNFDDDDLDVEIEEIDFDDDML